MRNRNFPRPVSGLEVIVAPGPLTIKARGSSYVHGMFHKYCMLPRKNPALFGEP